MTDTTEALYRGLRALYGHDIEVARRELAWAENNLHASPEIPLIATVLRDIVKSLNPS